MEIYLTLLPSDSYKAVDAEADDNIHCTRYCNHGLKLSKNKNVKYNITPGSILTMQRHNTIVQQKLPIYEI